MDNTETHKIIANRLGLQPLQVLNTVSLLNEGATIPFISRYRKEKTFSLDEVKISEINDEYNRITELSDRRKTILKSLSDQEIDNPELVHSIESADNMAQLEDLYLPYKPKRRTRAKMAREKGLDPLASKILKFSNFDPYIEAGKYLNDHVKTVDEALSGASDIIAETISEDIRVRQQLRSLYENQAIITSKSVKKKEEEGSKYRDYFEWSEKISRCPSHRYLAMTRGENEGYLKLSITPPPEKALILIERFYNRNSGKCSEVISSAIQDSWKRLLSPSMENEFRSILKDKADESAISVFASNLRQLLLSSPLGEKSVMAIDPGYRTGCKLVCLSRQGNLLHNDVIFPHPPQKKSVEAEEKVVSLSEKFNIEAIAIGNGTAGRETESFVKGLKFNRSIPVFLISEAGASIYSASAVAREEFPNHDVTVRGAVSIGRRLMDPLAELVKIEPKSIGVGQYQHDVDQNKLQKSLDSVVVSCVNQVGVDVNTASSHILTYISGLGPQLARNIIAYRTENGAFNSRKDLMKVKRMGAKSFEQCAGFLRIRDGKNPLDASAVHPESYRIVKSMATDLNLKVIDLIGDVDRCNSIDLNQYVSSETGLPTLKDIIAELIRPGRDPRSQAVEFSFADVHSMEDLSEGMVLPGIITNITNFGAFVDIGIKQDGLVHISHLSNSYVSDPAAVVKLNQQVRVKVLSIDIARRRIGLSMKEV